MCGMDVPRTKAQPALAAFRPCSSISVNNKKRVVWKCTGGREARRETSAPTSTPAWLGRTPRHAPLCPCSGGGFGHAAALGTSVFPRKPWPCPALPGATGATGAPRPEPCPWSHVPLRRQAGKFSGEVRTATNRVYKNTSKLSRSARTGAKTGQSFEGGAGGC